jgi:hypothetical protein
MRKRALDQKNFNDERGSFFGFGLLVEKLPLIHHFRWGL